jgi:hypothetical protein
VCCVHVSVIDDLHRVGRSIIFSTRTPVKKVPHNREETGIVTDRKDGQRLYISLSHNLRGTTNHPLTPHIHTNPHTHTPTHVKTGLLPRRPRARPATSHRFRPG